MFSKEFRVPGLLTYFALTGGFMFVLTLTIVLMRLFGKRTSPAIMRDFPAIISMN